jgi:NitT/TauT family transport system ATP-binding protein
VSKTLRRGATEVRALDRVDVTIGAGEFVCLVGPSGCGKSTLMRIVAGLVPATEGRVVIDGRTVDGPETRLGIVFQSPVLLDWRTVLGNVLLQVELRGLDPKRHAARARALLAAVGLDGFEDSRPRELSGGMRQRCAIVRALIHDPPLLLMDEPFGALDALTREQMRVDLEDLWLQTRKTVVFITHSIDEAVLLADRVLVMTPRPGRIERVVDIGLPRPRGLQARKARGFAAAAEAITEIFLERGVLHAAAGGLAARLGTPAPPGEPSGE